MAYVRKTDAELLKDMNSKYPRQLWRLLAGQGAFGKVYRGHRFAGSHIGKPVCVKKYERTSEGRGDYFREKGVYEQIGISASDACMNIPILYDAYELPEGYFLIMEYFDNGNLGDIFTEKPKYTEIDVREVVWQVATALEHCTRYDIVHRDVKPENVLVRKWEPLEIALTDFNLAASVGPRKGLKTIMHTCAGTLGYQAPEVYQANEEYLKSIDIKGKGKEKLATLGKMIDDKVTFNYKCDIWSLGCMAYQLLSGGYRPFRLTVDDVAELRKMVNKDHRKKSTVGMIVDHLLRNKLTFTPESNWIHVTHEAKLLISNMLVKNYKDRADFDYVLRTNPWLDIDILEPVELYDPKVVHEDELEFGMIDSGLSYEQQNEHESEATEHDV